MLKATFLSPGDKGKEENETILFVTSSGNVQLVTVGCDDGNIREYTVTYCLDTSTYVWVLVS